MFNRNGKKGLWRSTALIMLSCLFLPALHAFALSGQDLYNEMHLPHAGYPHGVPHDYTWYAGPQYKDLNFPTTTYTPVSSSPHTWDAYVPWGQVYEAEEGNPATNTRVQIRDVQSYYLSYADNQWHQTLYEVTPSGGYYREDFQGNTTFTGPIRNESDGSISVVPGGGHVFHFFPSIRAVVSNPSDVKAIYGTFQARLMLDNPNGTDDRSIARFVANSGIDLWYNASVGWDNFQTNGDTGISRFKYVTNDYQYFSTYSAKPGVDITTAPAPPTAGGGTTPPPSGYSEDFNDNAAQSWTLPSGISVSGGNLHTDSWSADPFATYDGATYSAPYTYTVDVKTTAGSDGNRTKIIFNAADSANYYSLDLGGGTSPNIYLKKVIGGTESTIATSAAHTSIVDSSVYTTIEITYGTGGTITAKATKNGSTTTLFSGVTDTSRTSGKIGVSVHASLTQFDNVSVSTSTPPPPPPPSGYSEDFNDNAAQSWTLPSGISVSGGNLHTDSWSVDPFATYDGATYSAPYTYKVDVKTTAGSDGNRTKIIFNAADSANYYSLDLGGGTSPNIYLKKVIGGTESTIATSAAHTSIVDSSVYTTIEITYGTGGTITAKATKNGSTTTLFSGVTDSSRTSGKIGVSVHASMTQFDNVSVTSP